MSHTFDSALAYLDLPHSLRYPVLEERHVVADILRSRRAAPPAVAESPRTVLIVPGFLDDGRAVRPLVQRLGAAGHHAELAEIGRNVACGEVMLQRLEAALFDVAERAAEPVVLIGHSRGGSLSRALTVRHPELVAGLVTLGSPLSRPHGVNAALRVIKLGMRVASRVGVPGLIGECSFGTCCDDYLRDLTGPFPEGIPFVSVRARHDGMVAADAVEDPGAKVVEVEASHAGLPFAPESVAVVEAALTDFPELASA